MVGGDMRVFVGSVVFQGAYTDRLMGLNAR